MAIERMTLNFRYGRLANNILHSLLLLIVLLTLASCEFRRTSFNQPISQADIQFITPGTTTLREVVEHLGAPDEISGSQERARLQYNFSVRKSITINFGWIARFFIPFSPNMSVTKNELGFDTLHVSLDRDLVVTDRMLSVESDDTGYNPWPF